MAFVAASITQTLVKRLGIKNRRGVVYLQTVSLTSSIIEDVFSANEKKRESGLGTLSFGLLLERNNRRQDLRLHPTEADHPEPVLELVEDPLGSEQHKQPEHRSDDPLDEDEAKSQGESHFLLL